MFLTDHSSDLCSEISQCVIKSLQIPADTSSERVPNLTERRFRLGPDYGMSESQGLYVDIGERDRRGGQEVTFQSSPLFNLFLQRDTRDFNYLQM